MIKVHLRIHTGADDRFELISKTIKVSADYFDSIRILNLGPSINSHKYKELLNTHKNLTVVDFEKHYTLCVTSDILRHHYHDVPNGEWVCWLDSDWRLPQSSLDRIQTELALAEKEDFNCIYSYQIGHSTEKFDHHLFIDPVKTDEDNQKTIETAIAHFKSSPDAYGWPLFQKVNRNMMWYDSWFENHGYVLQVPYKKKSIPDLYHLHIRSFLPKDYCKTMTYQCWWYLGHHVFSQDEQYYIINSDEYKNLELFKEKYKCFTSHVFDVMLSDPKFKEELTKLFLSFKDSKIFSCQQMYKMAAEHNMDFSKTTTPPPCTAICCKYKDGYIKDL